ncbi:DREPP plasma membrane polypeptide [Musa troglodytarum]|uniref:DREPP plasma membrane polypeptide n=1 Tax=Musa troglodytarum TaxID=320322 RepID=A0A9E7F3Q0_9LILI|nr:DREPP plasma membrane polypeptide [Musa troglodytarum]
MVNYWKTKVLPKIKKVFDRNGKKAAAAEACKSFDESKEEITKELEEKKADLQPKVVEIYEASAVEIKTLVKQPTESGVKKKSAVVIKFIEELVKIEFPGSKPVSEAASKHGPALVSGPVIFIFEKVSTLLPAEAEPEPEPAAAVETTSKEITPEGVEETKKEEAEKAEEAPAPPAPAEEAPAPPEPAPEPAKA